MCIERRKHYYNSFVAGDKMKDFDFQKRIQDLMQAAGIDSQYDLAKRCGVDRHSVTRWMKPGRVLSYESVCKLCKCFDIRLSQFFEDDFVDRRGDGPTKELRSHWKEMNEWQRRIYVRFGDTAVRLYTQLFGEKDPSSFS